MESTDLKATRREVIISRLISLAIIVFVFIVPLSAGNVKTITLRLFDQREMVAGNYSAFCRDRDGFLWVGTDAGLLCSDGNHCRIYRNDERNDGSISDNNVFSLYCDKRGNMWVGTVNGLNYYDRASDAFRHVTLPELSLNGFIRDIAELPDGRIIFLVSGLGLYSVDMSAERKGENDLKAKRILTGLPDEHGISRITDMGTHGIAMSTRTGEVALWKPGKSVERLVQIDGNVSNLALESDRSLILTTQYEVYRLDLVTRQLTPLPVEGGSRIKITDTASCNGVTWLSTAGDGVWEISKDSRSVSRSDNLHSATLNLPLLKISNIYADNGGNLWLGCNHRGVAMAPSGSQTFINRSLHSVLQDTGGGEITCMVMDGGNTVVGLNNGGILVMGSGGNLRKVIATQGSPVTSLAAWKPGKVLVGVPHKGILCLDIPTLKLSPMVSIDRAYPGVVITSGKEGEILAAFGEIGVLRYNPSTGDSRWFYPQNGSDLLSSFYYSGLSMTSDGKIWIGGYSGLGCYDPATDSLIPIDQSPFLKGVVHAVCDAGDGSIMIGTDKGLLRYIPAKGVERKYTVADGLSDNDVRTLVSDRKGGIWIGTMGGLSYLASADAKIQTYGGGAGLSRKAYTFSGGLNDAGSVVLADYENLVIFNPDSVRPAAFGGVVRITDIYLNGQRLTEKRDPEHRQYVTTGAGGQLDAVHLPYKETSLVIGLSTMDFRDASDLRYEWQMDGEKETWHKASAGEDMLYLPLLDPGSHTLRIRGWENGMSSDVNELKVYVASPWYLTDIAYVAYALVGLMILALLYTLVKNKEEEAMYEARIKYFMDISHEIRSPITLLLTPVDALLKKEQSPETTAQLLTVRRNAQRVLNLADQLLDLRKIEKGKMKLTFTPTDIRTFVGEIVEMFRAQAEEKGLTIKFVCEEKMIRGEVDRNNLDKILINLISNAVKYTPSGGEVVVSLSTGKDQYGAAYYQVKVIDTGIGLDNKKISHLFERFYRNIERHHTDIQGYGIGLDLCLRLVALHKGEITGKNREDGVKGSVFTVVLPFVEVSEVKEDEKTHHNFTDSLPKPRQAAKGGSTSSRFRILVVDDDFEMREYVKENLGGSFKVVSAANGEEALKEIGERHPDLILTDIRMEGVDGLELLRRIKGNMATQHIPVILFSSSNRPDDRTKGWKRGADGYLAKPFSIDELEGMIQGLLYTRNKIKGKFSGTQENVDKIEAPKVKGMDEELMKRVNRFINDNLSETSLNVDSLSEFVGLSRSQLHRRLKDILGMSPSDYIRNVKLRKACEMLSQGDVDIAQVAYSLGFNAQSHFSTLFKRFTGLTPSEYRAVGKGRRPGVNAEIERSDD